MTKEETAVKLTELFPQKAIALTQHYAGYNGQLLAHIFFADEINIPLLALLRSNHDKSLIRKYCSFVEKMYYNGNEDVKNVVDVTILEQLSDDETIWRNFGTYISNDFICEINTVLIPQNTMLPNRPLSYNKRRTRKKTEDVL